MVWGGGQGWLWLVWGKAAGWGCRGRSLARSSAMYLAASAPGEAAGLRDEIATRYARALEQYRKASERAMEIEALLCLGRYWVQLSLRRGLGPCSEPAQPCCSNGHFPPKAQHCHRRNNRSDG